LHRCGSLRHIAPRRTEHVRRRPARSTS
jgi:hypothetical protein